MSYLRTNWAPRLISIVAAAITTLASGVVSTLEKQTPDGATGGTAMQTFRTGSGGQVAKIDELGTFTSSGGITVLGTLSGKGCTEGASFLLLSGRSRTAIMP